MCIYSLLRLVALKSLVHLHNMSVLSYVYLLSLPKYESLSNVKSHASSHMYVCYLLATLKFALIHINN